MAFVLKKLRSNLYQVSSYFSVYFKLAKKQYSIAGKLYGNSARVI